MTDSRPGTPTAGGLHTAHRARLAPQPRGERLAQREHASADALLAFEDDRLVAGAPELGRRDQPGHARADHRDASRTVGARTEAVGQDAEGIRSAVGRGGAQGLPASGRSRTTSSS